MPPDELESVAARHVPGRGTLEIQRLSDGLVNETYRVLRDGAAYVLRVAAPAHHGLGFDHVWEARVLERAVQAGIAPHLEYCEPRRGILIARWVDGRAWSPADVRRPSNISRMAALMHRIHALPMPTPARIMSPKMWIDRYASAVAYTAAVPSIAAAPNITAALRAAAAMRLAALEELPSAEPVLCHSDLHTLNLIDRGNSLVLLDWEYAHAADPLWDLAGWSANNDLEDALKQELLASYAGRAPTPAEHLRLRLLGWLYDYVCLLWSELYLKLSHGAQRDEVLARARLLAARLGLARPGLTRPGASM
jgi:thiamine kinase-like enzyme